MTPLFWLALALAAGAAAYALGWPVLKSRRSREAVALNAERYLAWRGRARPPVSRATPEGLTSDERRRLVVAGLAAVLAVAGLVAFFATS
ncbi:MAG: hypothetical protein ABI841_06095 [Chloroflexota bacterium]